MNQPPLGKRAISERDRALFEMPSIESQMPVHFKNGNMFEQMDCYCSECDEAILKDCVRGEIQRPFEHVAVIEAVGACIECRLLTPFQLRLHDDMRITGLRDGKWVTWYGSSSLWDMVLQLLSSIIYRKPGQK
jgi:hypothetical protein